MKPLFLCKNDVMIQIEGKTVAQLVTEDFRTADVFKKNGIDFCCGGKVLVKDICLKKKVSYDEIVKEIEDITKERNSAVNYNDWSLEFLTDYIIEKHHAYCKTNIPLILQYAEKVARVHGDTSPETIDVHTLFDVIAKELSGHMQKEELLLFPQIKKLGKVQKGEMDYVAPPFGTLKNPINQMEIEHEQVGDFGEKIKQITNNYTPPQHACTTFRVLYAKLKEFEADLHEHIHLENNILFPKAIALEEYYQ